MIRVDFLSWKGGGRCASSSLTFDGVLNREGEKAVVPPWVKLEGYDWSDAWILPHLVYRLRPIVELTGVRIVVSSSWRFHWAIGLLRRILNEAHAGIGDRVVGTTPLNLEYSRSRAIRVWLRHHSISVRRYAILDNEELTGDLSWNHVRVDARVGLTEENVAQAIRILTRSAAAAR